MTEVVLGMDELLSKLKMLGSPSEQRKIARPAVSKGGTVILQAVRRATPVHTGTLRKAIAKQVTTDTASGEIVAKIGAQKGKAPHFHLVALGTGPRFKDSGASTGIMPAAVLKAVHDLVAADLVSYDEDTQEVNLTKDVLRRS